jgi:hypothetical protein
MDQPIWIPYHIRKRFSTYPLWLRVGTWSPLTHISLLFFSLYLVANCTAAKESYAESDYSQQSLPLSCIRILCGVWGFIVICLICYYRAFWVFISYTFWTWTICTLRLSFAGIASICHSCHGIRFAADILRFPALAQSIITVFVWWSIVFPSILYITPTGKERRDFINYNLRSASRVSGYSSPMNVP